MRPVLVVVLAPVLDEHLGLGEAGEQLDGEQLVPDSGAEALDVGVLPRRARLDVRAPGPREAAPVAQGVGGQLGTVVAADERRRRATLADEPVEHGDGVVGVDAAAALDRQRLPRELVNHVQQLQDPAVGGLIELEVKRPHVIGPLGPQPVGRNRRVPQALALAPPDRHPETLLAPQPLHALAVDLPALLQEQLMRAAVPPPRPPPGDPPKLRPQRRIITPARS